MKKISLWGALWRSKNRKDGVNEHLLWDATAHLPRLFHTKAEAQAWIDKNYSYFKYRPDLRGEPHGWKMPKPVRVSVTVDKEGKP